MNQTILECDEDGSPTGGYVDKEVAHTGTGRHHLAITVLVYNNQNQVLLQRRKHKVFDDIWDMTASTHQLRLDDHDETDEEAALRSLKREYGIDQVSNLQNLGGINYFAQYGNLCENEHDKILTAFYDGPINLNDEVGYSYKWMDKAEFLKDITQNPQKYSPWSVKAIPLLEKSGFFG